MRPNGEDARLFWRAGEDAPAIDWKPEQRGSPSGGWTGRDPPGSLAIGRGVSVGVMPGAGTFWWAVMSAPDELKWPMIIDSRPGGWGLGFGPGMGGVQAGLQAGKRRGVGRAQDTVDTGGHLGVIVQKQS